MWGAHSEARGPLLGRVGDCSSGDGAGSHCNSVFEEARGLDTHWDRALYTGVSASAETSTFSIPAENGGQQVHFHNYRQVLEALRSQWKQNLTKMLQVKDG